MAIYVTIGAIDGAKSSSFYDAVLATIGWSSHVQYPNWRAYSEGGLGKGPVVWICKPFDGQPASNGNGSMVGFMAGSPAEVDAFHAAALANGGTDEGAPGPRPNYGPKFYAAYMRDPAGNKISAVHNG